MFRIMCFQLFLVCLQFFWLFTAEEVWQAILSMIFTPFQIYFFVTAYRGWKEARDKEQ